MSTSFLLNTRMYTLPAESLSSTRVPIVTPPRLSFSLLDEKENLPWILPADLERSRGERKERQAATHSTFHENLCLCSWSNYRTLYEDCLSWSSLTIETYRHERGGRRHSLIQGAREKHVLYIHESRGVSQEKERSYSSSMYPFERFSSSVIYIGKHDFIISIVFLTPSPFTCPSPYFFRLSSTHSQQREDF